MKLVLITGAGASRQLGAGGNDLPLMGDWSGALALALEKSESGLPIACGLNGTNGEEFERNLGALLAWERAGPLEQKFKGLGTQPIGTGNSHVDTYLQQMQRRLTNVKQVINHSLYDEFSMQRVDDDAAGDAYRALLKILGEPDRAVATTNYDLCAETGLRGADREVLAGFEASDGRTPRLRAAGMFARRGSAVPVLHLHGAVGWYAVDGAVEQYPADKPFNSSHGSPVVLYPDPEKDPTNSEFVQELWTEFRAALEWSDHVLVLGHSLHDPPLKAVLREFVSKGRRMAVTCANDGEADYLRAAVSDQVQLIRLKFGPKIELDAGQLAAWPER